MGIQGTEVAKESSDIIILDDNFASVVKVSKHVILFHEHITKSFVFCGDVIYVFRGMLNCFCDFSCVVFICRISFIHLAIVNWTTPHFGYLFNPLALLLLLVAS